MLSMSLATATVSRIMAVLKSFIKDNLKVYFDFKNTDLEHVGTGSANFATNQSLTIPTAVLDDAAAFTIMAWAKKASLGDADGLVICGNASSGFYYRSVNATSITASVALDGANAVLTSSSFTDSLDWMHFAITYDGSIVTTYVDGVAKGTNTSGSGVVTSGSTIDRIGEYGTTFHNGKLKNFAVWHRALSISEIQNVMHKTYTELQGSELTHLQSWYALESSTLSGSDATGNNDITANNNTVTFTDSIYGGNTPTKPRGVDNSKAALADQIGSGSASFNGTSDYIAISHNSNLAFASAGHDDDSAFSVVAWIKPVDATKFRVISKSNDTNSEWIFSTNSSDKVTMTCYDNTTANNIGRPSTASISQNVWTHIAGTYAGGEAEAGFNIYVNGVLDNGTAYENGTYVAMHNLETDVWIGASDDINDYADGNIAQLGVFNAVLTQEQIQSISQKTYSELTTSEKTNLVSWWGLDEVFLGSNNIAGTNDAGTYDKGSIVEDKAGSLTEVLIDNIDTADNWEVGSNASISIDGDGNLLATVSGGSGDVRIKSSVVTLDASSTYICELAVAGGTDTSVNVRLDDEDYGQIKYGNAYYDTRSHTNSNPGHVSFKFYTGTNTGFYLKVGNIDDTKTTIIKHFKLYKVTSGNPGVLI